VPHQLFVEGTTATAEAIDRANAEVFICVVARIVEVVGFAAKNLFIDTPTEVRKTKSYKDIVYTY
jgi:hypothetical protein